MSSYGQWVLSLGYINHIFYKPTSLLHYLTTSVLKSSWSFTYVWLITGWLVQGVNAVLMALSWCFKTGILMFYLQACKLKPGRFTSSGRMNISFDLLWLTFVGKGNENLRVSFITSCAKSPQHQRQCSRHCAQTRDPLLRTHYQRSTTPSSLTS